jgi:hypothetical protein
VGVQLLVGEGKPARTLLLVNKMQFTPLGANKS